MRRIFYFLMLSLGACQDRQPALPNPSGSGDLNVVYTTSLREAPGEKSAELKQLKPGATLKDMGKISPFLSGIYLNDTLRREPWLQVNANDGTTGWVFAGAVQPAQFDAAATHQWVLENRFKACFGTALDQRWKNWMQTADARTDADFATFMRTGLELRDTINLLLSRSVTRSADHLLSDMFWLQELSPLFVVQQIAQGASYALFVDYRFVTSKATQTTGRQDDAYAQVGLAAYPLDSIESALPVWVFPLSAEAGCSNLGQGFHVKILQSIDKALAAGVLFRPQLEHIKEQVMEDIVGKESLYWQPEDKIRQELSQILQTKPRCLEDTDLQALRLRLNLFANPEANGIVVNMRSGKSL